MKNISKIRRAKVVSLALAVSLLAAGCSTVSADSEGKTSDDANTNILSELNWSSSDLGSTAVSVEGDSLVFDLGGSKVTVDKSKGLNIAFFSASMDTTYTQAMSEGIKFAADELGAKATVFEAGWDPNKQLSQIENAIQSGEYNAFVVYAAEGATVCKALTEDAPNAGIAVVPVITPLCGKTLAEGLDLVAPGTVSTIMGGGTVEYYKLWADFVSSQITKPTKVVYIAGPSSQDVVIAAEEALKAAAASNPNFELQQVYYGDYSSDSGLKETQNALVTFPDTQLILSHFSSMTIGILSALADANRTDVQVYDLGGDKTMKKPIEEGKVTNSVPYFPYTTGACSVDILNSAFSGKSIPTLVLSECGRGGSATNVQSNVVIDKENVAIFPFEY